ncbi:hypothetical protein [Peribacillus frigoritolerans]|uniref:Uncharacterized protein n=1 Tax=Peribacillus castrilensis TaxID=2897690 RepID=A0AAW9NJ49_9BACI|nr:hypothetical protein [Peribacillus castrilensis]
MIEKTELEKQHSEKMNEEAINRIKKEEELSIEEREAAIFEDDAVVTLRNGKKYSVPPLTLKNARQLMKKLRTVNVDAIILNFIPTGNDDLDKKREGDLFDILIMAFVNYPEVDRDYIDEFMDLETARNVIDTLIGINGIKK